MGGSAIGDLELSGFDAVSGGWSVVATGDGIDASPSGAIAPLVGTAPPSGFPLVSSHFVATRGVQAGRYTFQTWMPQGVLPNQCNTYRSETERFK
jgi:hypothetical protein